MAKHPQPRKYTPRHPEKYEGDYTNVWARSSWELKFFNWCDSNPSIVKWCSEEIIIPYRCPTDNRVHRYFPDAKIQVRDKDGKLHVYIVEIKPYKQTKPPVKRRQTQQQYLNEVMTWGKNTAKWKATEEYCKDRGYKFKLITERELGITK